MSDPLATARVLSTCARDRIVNWRVRGQYRPCDKSEEKAVTRPQPPYFRAPIRFTEIALWGEHFNTSRGIVKVTGWFGNDVAGSLTR